MTAGARPLRAGRQMLVAVVSDIHANLQALEAVCLEAGRRGADRWACLGDLVGYGADPVACCRRIRGLTQHTVQGNHDAAVAGRSPATDFNPWARQAVEWTAERMDAEWRGYLASLSLTARCGEALLVHGDPRWPAAWGYVSDPLVARAALAAVDARLCFVGHSHEPFACVAAAGTEARWVRGSGRLHLGPGERCLVNAGSVGQPRDGDPRACLVLWDQEDGSVELARVEYDVARAQERILAAGLPALLAERLAVGE